MLLADVVATSEAIAAARARSVKVEALAGLLAHVEPDEIEPVVGFLSGEVRQGRIGIGWATVASIDADAVGCHVAHRGRRGRLPRRAGHDGGPRVDRAPGRPAALAVRAGDGRRRVTSSAGCSPASCARAPSKALMTDAIAKAADGS